MHRALEIAELVELICFQFPTNDRGVLDKESSKALPALGRTSKTFCNPALNRLWRRQDTITNLLECMPVDLWDIQEAVDETSETASVDTEEESSLIITLLRPIISSDWDRPQFYTPRVKDFSLETEFVTVDLFDALCVSRMGECIFPNLETLRWMQRTCDMFHYVRLFLTPRVADLAICSIQRLSHLSMIPTLPGRCPTLKRLQCELQSSELQDAAIPIISRAVCDLAHLESLHVPALNEKALAHISQLSNLGYLSLESAGGITRFIETRAAVCFPALSALAVVGMRTASALLSTLTQCPLVEFRIPHSNCSESSWPTKNTARLFYSALASHCHAPSLRRINIYFDFWDRDVKPTADQIRLYSVDQRILEPLLSFANLSSLILIPPVGFDLDDATIVLMACTWPQIATLSLTANPCRHMPSRVTLEGLASLSKYCPDLCRLDISFDATMVPPIRDQGKTRVGQQTLVCIGVGCSPVSNARRVAKFLAVIFPRLKYVETLRSELLEQARWSTEVVEEFDAEIVESEERWRDVEDELEQLVA
ncbi:hypothetical protein C8R46DRAFT_1088262 [Mycena filopes]|nr:hypothetical protein C8R46DRAFT_1088262 [Mycena filopes]